MDRLEHTPRPSSPMDLPTTTAKPQTDHQIENRVGFMDNCLEQEVAGHDAADRLEQKVAMEDRLEHAPHPFSQMDLPATTAKPQAEHQTEELELAGQDEQFVPRQRSFIKPSKTAALLVALDESAEIAGA